MAERKEVPSGLAMICYARMLCDELVIPYQKNEVLMRDCLQVIAKKHKQENRGAFLWLLERIESAQTQGININEFWFRDGGYNKISPLTVECDKHPDSGRTPAGNCWQCYAEKHESQSRKPN